MEYMRHYITFKLDTLLYFFQVIRTLSVKMQANLMSHRHNFHNTFLIFLRKNIIGIVRYLEKEGRAYAVFCLYNCQIIRPFWGEFYIMSKDNKFFILCGNFTIVFYPPMQL